MAYEDYQLRIEALIGYIEQEKTGSAEELSKKLRVSRRTVCNYIDALRIKGKNIQYCKSRNTYYFAENK